jgi:hypothetical protein
VEQAAHLLQIPSQAQIQRQPKIHLLHNMGSAFQIVIIIGLVSFRHFFKADVKVHVVKIQIFVNSVWLKYVLLPF